MSVSQVFRQLSVAEFAIIRAGDPNYCEFGYGSRSARRAIVDAWRTLRAVRSAAADDEDAADRLSPGWHRSECCGLGPCGSSPPPSGRLSANGEVALQRVC